MIALVYDYVSIASHMKGELAPHRSETCHDNVRALVIRTVHPEQPRRLMLPDHEKPPLGPPPPWLLREED